MKADKKKKTVCMRCGRCCLANLLAYTREEDIKRWQAEDRQDILAQVNGRHAIWAGDHFTSNHGAYLKACPFLELEGRVFKCRIYQTRPRVCREFEPGSSRLCPWYRG